MEYAIEKLADNMWTIDQKGVRAFLLVGTEQALLVDTCFGGDMRTVIESVTDKPVILITTHADPDHIGSDDQFPIQYLHSKEFSLYESRAKKTAKALPLEEGAVFDIGNFSLEIIHIPGHTPGSIALLDRKHRFLISGDTVQDNCIFMHGDGRDLAAFRESVYLLNQLRLDGIFDVIHPSHGPAVVAADILEDHIALADLLLRGDAIPSDSAPAWFPESVKTYRYHRAQMYY